MSNNTVRSYSLVAAAWLALSPVLGCAVRSQQAAESDLADARANVRELAEANQDCTEKADCAALPVGQKPCGGPWEYLAYSKNADGAEELVEAASELEKQERAYNVEFEIVSDCLFVVEPATDCVADKCVTLESK
jgi:hypothetical protein